MDRQIVYPGQIPLETDLLNTNRNIMTALGKLVGALFGTGGIVNGLAVAPQSPASLSVNVGAGEIYQLANVDNSAYSSLPADTTDTTVKQGILLQPAAVSCPAPGTAGFSINYLIEATFHEADVGSVVLQYYNASNPQQAYSGPNNTGAAQAVTRAGQVSIQAKAGIAATTGTQTTPAADAGYIALAVVTVAYGQTQITASNITAVGTGTLPAGLLQAVQNNQLNYAKDTGSAGACVVTLRPAPATLIDGMVVEYQVAASNTGAATLNLNGLGALPILGGAHQVLQGGELAANGTAEVRYHAGLASWVLLGSTGGAQQVAAASQTGQAVNLGQFANNIVSSGYQKLPGGLILQWGGATVSGGAGQAVATFPIAWPNGILKDQGMSGTTNQVVTGVSATLTTRTFQASVGNTAAAAPDGSLLSYIAIGH